MKKPRKRILWVEDESQVEMQGFLGPLYVSAKYEITIAQDATTALELLGKGSNDFSSRFDAVLIDIRIPPGNDQRWLDLYNSQSQDPASAKLGLVLLRAIFSRKAVLPEESRRFRWAPDEWPAWLSPKQVAVVSVEGEDLANDLSSLGIPSEFILAKTPDLPRSTLVALLDRMTSLGGAY